jgi:mandelamide amidase
MICPTSRRAFLATAAASATGTLLGRSAHAMEPAATRPLTDLDAMEAVTALRRGELEAESYAAALLARARQCAALNAFVTLQPESVLEAARQADRLRRSGAPLGPLHGLPVPVKDSVNTRDLPTTAGTPALRTFQPRTDAAVVARLRAAGAIVMGKTGIHELSFGWTSNNLAFGAVRNPYDASRVPGGSSGGTAAAIAARMAPLGVAEDTQGSIRVPAAFCGIAGFRPTTGRYPNEGTAPITPLFDQVGPHARSVDDLVLFDTVVADAREPIGQVELRGLRLGIDPVFFEALDPEVARITDAALKRLRDAGVILLESPVTELRKLLALTTAQIQLHDVIPSLDLYLKAHGAGIDSAALIAEASSDIREAFASFGVPGAPAHVSAADYRAARDVHLPALRDAFARWFAETGAAALVFPTVQIPAAPIGQATVDIGGMPVSFDEAAGRNIASGSTAGLPGLVLPSGLTRDGLPVSLELDGPARGDRRLLAIGRAVEQVLGRLPAPPQCVG